MEFEVVQGKKGPRRATSSSRGDWSSLTSATRSAGESLAAVNAEDRLIASLDVVLRSQAADEANGGIDDSAAARTKPYGRVGAAMVEVEAGIWHGTHRAPLIQQPSQVQCHITDSLSHRGRFRHR